MGFNFGTTIPADEPREPLDIEEGFRLIQLKLRIVGIEPPGKLDGQELPVVYFQGMGQTLSPMPNCNGDYEIRGQAASF